MPRSSSGGALPIRARVSATTVCSLAVAFARFIPQRYTHVRELLDECVIRVCAVARRCYPLQITVTSPKVQPTIDVARAIKIFTVLVRNAAQWMPSGIGASEDLIPAQRFAIRSVA